MIKNGAVHIHIFCAIKITHGSFQTRGYNEFSKPEHKLVIRRLKTCIIYSNGCMNIFDFDEL